MSRSHFQRIVIAVAKPASKAVAIHVALVGDRPVIGEGVTVCPFVPSQRYSPVVIPRVQPGQRFGCGKTEKRVAVLDGVHDSQSGYDDLPRSES